MIAEHTLFIIIGAILLALLVGVVICAVCCLIDCCEKVAHVRQVRLVAAVVVVSEF
jgi:hypothetical protein